MAEDQFTSSIQNLYAIFAPHSTVSNGFGDCVWLTEINTVTLKTKALRQLSADELQIYAENWSRCGNEDDLKHFLPRLLDLFSHHALHTPPEMLLRGLPYATCSPAEVSAIDSILQCMWTEFVNSFPVFYGPDEFLCGLAQLYPDLAPFVDVWENINSPEALRQLALFSTEATYCYSWRYCPAQKQQIINWLLDSHTIQRLENGALTYAEASFANELLEGAIALQHWKDELEAL